MKKWFSKRLITTLVGTLLVPMATEKFGWAPEVTWAVAGTIAFYVIGETLRPSGTTGVLGNGGTK